MSVIIRTVSADCPTRFVDGNLVVAFFDIVV